jgi:hypothetical protein
MSFYLIDVDEKRLEDSDAKVVGREPSADVSQLCHHALFQNGAVNVMTLKDENKTKLDFMVFL